MTDTRPTLLAEDEAFPNSQARLPRVVACMWSHWLYSGPMDVSVRELKARLSHYLKLAAYGERVTVTSRGRPVARLLPATPQASKKTPSAAEIKRRLAAIPGIILGEPG